MMKQLSLFGKELNTKNIQSWMTDDDIQFVLQNAPSHGKNCKSFDRFILLRFAENQAKFKKNHKFDDQTVILFWNSVEQTKI